MVVRKKAGYERNADATGSFSAIPLDVIENTGASLIPKLYGNNVAFLVERK